VRCWRPLRQSAALRASALGLVLLTGVLVIAFW
jgi:hypothetical protein